MELAKVVSSVYRHSGGWAGGARGLPAPLFATHCFIKALVEKVRSGSLGPDEVAEYSRRGTGNCRSLHCL